MVFRLWFAVILGVVSLYLGSLLTMMEARRVDHVDIICSLNVLDNLHDAIISSFIVGRCKKTDSFVDNDLESSVCSLVIQAAGL